LKDDPTTNEQLETEFTSGMGTAEIVRQEEIEVGGVPATLVEVSDNIDGVDVAGLVVVAMASDRQAFTFVAISPVERWEGEVLPQAEALLGSIEFFEPVEAALEPETPPDTTAPQGTGIEINQWATAAVASSEYGVESWSAMHATGAPNTNECGDVGTAWASYETTEIEWIELDYDTEVVPTQVNIHQTYNPGYITEVLLIELDGTEHSIYQATGALESECPFVLSIPITDVDMTVGVMSLRIILDQSALGSWSEIDAVEMVGYAMDGATVPAGSGGEVAWRVGGSNIFNEGEYGNFSAMAVGEDGLLYMFDENQGILVFDADGSLVNTIKNDEIFSVKDIKFGADGNLYIADWGNSAVFVMSKDGEIVNRFGEAGTGDGQFGTFSPVSLAIAPDGRVFVMDENELDGQTVMRMQIFSPDGKFLDSFPVVDENNEGFKADGMLFGQDGNLYMVGFSGSYILVYSPDGDMIGTVGGTDGNIYAPQEIAIDDDGNFYVLLSFDSKVLKLDPGGNLLQSYGSSAGDDDTEWEPGQLYMPSALAVLPDGSLIFVGDSSGKYSFLTVFKGE
ncbi:MAG: hypothetical protein EHM35_15225, partial [Planctomycetaceae bacterium]